MRKQINLELVQFHVHEAACELFSLVARLKEAQGEQLSRAEKIMAKPYRKLDLTESAIKVSLEHAYHHLNFAWNPAGTDPVTKLDNCILTGVFA